MKKKNEKINFVINIIFSTIIAWVIVILLICFIGNIWPKLEHIKDYLDLAQVVIEMILIPMVIVSYLVSKKEIDDSLKFAKLDLVWSDNKKHKISGILFPAFNTYDLPPISVINSGNLLSEHHQINLIFPPNVFVRNALDFEINPNQIRDNQTLLSYRSKDGEIMHPGLVEIFPETIAIFTDNLSYGFEIEYEIFVDKGSRIEGILRIDFDEDPSLVQDNEDAQ